MLGFRTDCVNGFRAQINFQSCWDGVNLYLDGNSHVAYLSGIDYGVCPPTHPVPIPGLFFEYVFERPADGCVLPADECQGPLLYQLRQPDRWWQFCVRQRRCYRLWFSR